MPIISLLQTDVVGACVADFPRVPDQPVVRAFCTRAFAFLNKESASAAPQAPLLSVRRVARVYLFIVKATGRDKVMDVLQAALAPAPPKALFSACVCGRMVVSGNCFVQASVNIGEELKKFSFEKLDSATWPASASVDGLRDELDALRKKGIKDPFVFVDHPKLQTTSLLFTPNT